jgi:hypothetical protein
MIDHERSTKAFVKVADTRDISWHCFVPFLQNNHGCPDNSVTARSITSGRTLYS